MTSDYYSASPSSSNRSREVELKIERDELWYKLNKTDLNNKLFVSYFYNFILHLSVFVNVFFKYK